MGSPLTGAVGDWLGRVTDGSHGGTFYDLVTRANASVTRATPKTIADPTTGFIHDVAPGLLAVNPWGAYKAGGVGFAPVIEEARTTLYVASTFADASALATWTADAGLTPTLGGPLLHAGSNSVTLVADGSNRAFWRPLTSTAASRSVSWWVKRQDGEAVTSDYCQGAAAAGTSTPVGTLLTTTFTRLGASVWYRATATYTGTAATWVSGIVVKANMTVVVTCPEDDLGAFALSYIPTTTAAVTRNADVVTVPTTGWNAAAGTMVAVAGDFASYASPPYLLSWDAGDSANQIWLYRTNSAYGSAGGRVRASTQYNVSSTKAAGGPSVFALTWANGAPAYAYVDGSAGAGSANVTTPAGLPTLAHIGNSISNNRANGPIHRLTIFPTAKDASAVAALNSMIDGYYEYKDVIWTTEQREG